MEQLTDNICGMGEKVAPDAEPLGKGYFVCVSKEHRFGTDAFLLADFAAPHRFDKVCDLCSGNGIVAFVMARNFSPAKIYAVEIQKSAYELLAESKKKSFAATSSDVIIPVMADLREWRSAEPRDLITCNPPYKTGNSGIKNRADETSIARHEMLCTVYDVCAAAKRSLRYGGRLCMCNRPERIADVICAMRECKIEPKRLRPVQKDPQSDPWLILVEGRLGGGNYLKMEKPLYIKGENGEEYSQEMKRIYSID